MATSIIVGVDNSETALRAADKAAEFAQALGAELHVISAYSGRMMENIRSIQSAQLSGPEAGAYNKLIDQYAGNAEGIANAVAETLRTRHEGLTVSSQAVEGTPAGALVAQAEAVQAELIVVGNKHVQGFARVLGSIARSVAAEAPCDLYIVNTTKA